MSRLHPEDYAKNSPFQSQTRHARIHTGTRGHILVSLCVLMLQCCSQVKNLIRAHFLDAKKDSRGRMSLQGILGSTQTLEVNEAKRSRTSSLKAQRTISMRLPRLRIPYPLLHLWVSRLRKISRSSGTISDSISVLVPCIFLDRETDLHGDHLDHF